MSGQMQTLRLFERCARSFPRFTLPTKSPANGNALRLNAFKERRIYFEPRTKLGSLTSSRGRTNPQETPPLAQTAVARRLECWCDEAEFGDRNHRRAFVL